MYLVEVIYGSRLFGTAIEGSDIDKKRIYLTGMNGLVFGKTDTRNVVTGSGASKVETEEHHISTFCRMVKQGQTLALSMLFAPDDMVTHRTPQWDELIRNRSRLVSKNLKPFVEYARSQASKYALKGERLRTLEDFLTALDQMQPRNFTKEQRFTDFTFNRLTVDFGNRPGVRLWTEQTANMDIRHIEICGKSFGETTPVKQWAGPLQAMFKRYGKRAQQAKEDDGSDLKAMYHSIRLIGELNEVLRTGHITYPRPEAPLLLDIRRGKLTNAEVAELIENGIAESNRLFTISTLRETPDNEWLDFWMVRTQAEYACESWQDEKAGE